MQPLSFTWLGHATFLFRSPGGKRILVDPFLEANPSCPEALKRSIGELDLILVTHAHDDHMGDAVPVARATGATVISQVEIGAWLRAKGLQRLSPMNHGGTQTIGGIAITMVPAYHSSSTTEDGRRVELGTAAGFVLRFEDGLTIYFAGDTAVFGDMRLIGEMYSPVIAFLPIGDHYTMGPTQAAKACELLGVKQVVPMHYGTFPVLTGTPAAFRALVEPRGVQVLELKPGETAS